MIRRLSAICAVLLFAQPAYAASQVEIEAAKGRLLLESNCGRCHAVMAGKVSPLASAPNLWIVLGSWPNERLEAEFADGARSRHREMPQVQFSSEEIGSIYYYLHGHGSEVEPGRQ